MDWAFGVAVLRLGVSPSEFWTMPPRHFWVLLAARREQEGLANPSALSSADKEAIRAELLGDTGRWF